MKQYFRTYVNFVQNNWIFLFFMIEFVYNNVNNISIDMSSFKINLNYNFRMIFEKKFDFKFRISNFDCIKSIKKIASIHCRFEKWICWNSKKSNSIQKQTKYCSNVQSKRHDLIECQKHKNQTKQQIETSIVRFFQNFR